MDKIETALTATEDNAAAIRALNNKLNAQAEMIDRLVERSSNTVIYGAASDVGATLGEVESDGTRCALILFNDGDKRKIIFCKTAISTTSSPVLIRLPAGRGELMTTAAKQVRAVIFPMTTAWIKLQ